MSPDSPASTSEISFRVMYESGRTYNRDLAGSGTLVIRPEAFVFRGRTRRSVFNGPPTELLLQPDQIWNVDVSDTAVQFMTAAGKSGEKKVPFVFYCDTAEDAARVGALLPAAKDASFVEAHAFHVKLLQLAGPGGGMITNAVIAANVIAFVVMGVLGAGWLDTASMRPYVLYAANNGAQTTSGEWWRLVTAMFTHYGVLHLALNMWALFQIGHLVEKLLGRTLFALMYFGSGIVASLATLVWHGDKMWSAGASGAVFGVYGALFGYLCREKQGMPRAVMQPLLKSTLTFAGYNLVIGAAHPHIDNVAHVGGLVAGALFGWLCALPLDRDLRARETPRRLALSGAVLAAAIVAGVTFAPRFDYRPSDDFRLEEAWNKHANAVQAVSDAGDKLVAVPASAATDAALAAWARDQAVPVYTRCRDDLAALSPKVGSNTAKRRDALKKVFDLSAASSRRLAESLAQHDSKARANYAKDNQAIEAVLAELKGGKE